MTAREPVVDSIKAATGLVVGKFLPPHAGHLALIEFARRQVRHLTVLVAELPGEPIAGATRLAWLRELLPEVEVRFNPDRLPQDEREDPDLYATWAASVLRQLPGPPALLFSSESYGEPFAAALGARHVSFDPARAGLPVSGSAIRRDPFAHWDYLPAPVRAHYTLRVVITGAESTGKTTLAAALARRFETVWLPEYGREYVDRLQAPPTLADIEPIARGHLAREAGLARQANRVLICDTDLLVTQVLSEDYFAGACPAFVVEAQARCSYHLWVLCGDEIPWEADPHQRVGVTARARQQLRFRDELRRRGLPHLEVAGSPTARVEQVAAVVAGLLARRPWPEPTPLSGACR